MKIDIKNLNYVYDTLTEKKEYTLKDINLKIDDNDFVAIIGESGSGKTTLIKHLNGILKATSGEIYIDGNNIYDKSYDLNKLRFDVGIAFQYPEYQLFSDTVIEDVMFGALNKGLSEEEAKEKAIEILLMLGIREELFEKLPFLLSGGEKRKVAIAGILIMQPKTLIFDEPEAGLDPKAKQELFSLLKRLNKNGTNIIFITHNISSAIEYANKIVVMKDGSVLNKGTPTEIFSNYMTSNNLDIALPDQILIRNYLANKYDKFNKNALKIKEIEDEIVKIKND